MKSQNQLPLHSKMLNSSDCCEGSVLTEDIWIISEKWKWNFNCKLVFQKFASVGSCQWKWKDVCFALEKISSEIQTENGTYGQIWSTWICFAKPTSSKPTRLSVQCSGGIYLELLGDGLCFGGAPHIFQINVWLLWVAGKCQLKLVARAWDF